MTSAASTTPANAVAANFAEEKAQYDEWVASFTPEQRAAYDALAPDKLEAMTGEQLADAFSVPLTEVAGDDGSIDPNLFVTSDTIRTDAANRGGCSEDTFSRYGGPLGMTHDDIAQEVAKYINTAARSVIGTDGNPGVSILERCVSVANFRSLGDEASEAIQPYAFVQRPLMDTIQYDDATGTLTWSMTITDNYDNEALYPYTGDSSTEQVLGKTSTVNLRDLHVTDDGRVMAAAS